MTRAFFAQANFGDVDILIEFHATLEAGLRSARGMRAKEIEFEAASKSSDTAEGVAMAQEQHKKAMEEREHIMYMGTSIRELIYKWRFKTLMLLKLLILQKKVGLNFSLEKRGNDSSADRVSFLRLCSLVIQWKGYAHTNTVLFLSYPTCSYLCKMLAHQQWISRLQNVNELNH